MTDDELIAATRTRLPSAAPPPASADELAEAERRLGFALPSLLRRLYTEVANGSWGPGYGPTVAIGGARVDLDDGLVDWYRTMRDAGADPDDASWPGWPDRLVAVCHWGCAIWSCVDCSTGRVIRFDPNVGWLAAWGLERPTLAVFLEDWLDDRPQTAANPLPVPAGFTAG